MNSDADYTVHSPREIAGPIQISTRKDLAKQRSSGGRKPKPKRRRPKQESAVKDDVDQTVENLPPSSDGEQHEVDYLA